MKYHHFRRTAKDGKFFCTSESVLDFFVRNESMNDKHKKRKRISGRKNVGWGVAIAVCIILAAGTFFAVSSYLKYNKFKIYNEYARNIFFAAQASMTNMTDDEFQNFRKKVSEEVTETDGLIYFQVKGPMDSRGILLFEDLTDGYIYDKDILNYAIGIELNLEEKSVSAVACADEGVILTNEGRDGKAYINFKDKDSSARKKQGLGYFDASMAVSEEKQEVKFSEAELINGDVLEAVFSLSEKEKMRIGQNAYEITIRDSEDNPVMTLVINDSRDSHLKPANDVSEEKTVSAQCRFYNGTEAQEMTFPAYIDSDYKAHFILDALDIGAAQGVFEEKEDAQKVYSSCYSAMRIVTQTGLSPAENISFSVRALSNENEEKTSGRESLLMGEDSTDENFTLQNARHLFNIRFIEASTPSGSMYTQTDSFAWGTENFGIVGAGHVFKNKEKLNTACFIPINCLTEGSTLTASSDTVIEGLRMENNVRTDEFGLFKENRGTIEKLTFNDMKIESGNYYTGGICGINSGTIREITVTDSSVTGSMYTGGIAGYQDRGKINDCEYTGGTVSAWSYGGAIAGASFEYSLIDECTVRAAVYAKEGYAGGLTGYNAGKISDSTSDIDLESEEGKQLLEATAAKGHSGDYTGGLVGYNNGQMTAEKQIEVSAVVLGRNYVGGVIGYNAPDAFVGSYALSGGYIKGQNCVGGIAGVNTSRAFLETEDVVRTSSPKKIYGDYFVGGIAGVNAVNAGSGGMIEFECSVDSENGEIIASGAYAGGVFGYEAITDDAKIEASKQETINTPEALVTELVRLTFGEDSTLREAQNVTQDVENIQVSVSDTPMKLMSEDTVRLLGVSGGLYVGGVIGMQQDNSRLIISEVSVDTKITAAKTEEIDGERFAYAGLFMGKIPEKTTLYQCSTKENAKLIHDGSYAGVFAEVNEGRLEQCESAGMDMGDRAGVGGFVGLNNAGEDFEGFISGCTLKGAVHSEKMSGGIAAVNRGYISGCAVKAEVAAAGDTAGGIAAVNDGGTITAGDGDESMSCKIDADISGENNVGAAAGINRGSISGCELGESNLFEGRRTISGKDNVGGFIGRQDDSVGVTVEKLILPSYADVLGECNVGGIVGAIDGRADIDACESYGTISAENGSTGGIAGVIGRGAVVKNCAAENISLSAPGADFIGGIAGENSGEIDNCRVTGDVTLTGTWRVGGIAGENSGNIKVSSVSKIRLVLKEERQGSCVGGIAGENSGNIENTTAQQSTKNEKKNEIQLQSWVNESYMGGIAGINSGKITSTNASVKMNTGAVLEIVNNASGFMGGIAGKNLGEIKYYRFTGQIKSDVKGKVVVGGIVGINGGETAAAYVEGCDVSDRALDTDRLTAESTPDNAGSKTIEVLGTNSVAGGIVGYNCAGASIIKSTPVKCYITAGGGTVGGIAGINAGLLSDCQAKNTGTGENIRVKIYTKTGKPGRIAGKTESGGRQENCGTGDDWYV